VTIIYWVVALPSLLFACWVWWGFVFITLKYLVHIGWQEGENMEDLIEHPARLIRYTALADAEHPNLLSAYDKIKNLQMIDAQLAMNLPESMRNRLEMSTLPATMIVDDGHGLRFGEYHQ